MAFEYNIDNEFDFTIDEKGNSFIALRKVQWGGKGEYKLDIRKWYSSSEGEDVVGKGVSFLTEEGPHELTKVLIDNGFGNTNEILHGLSKREDFNKYIEALNNGEDILNINIDDEDYYDPSEILF